MRFTTTIVSSVLASIAVASPVAHAPAVERQASLCSFGIPCFVQQEVDLSLSIMNGLVADLDNTGTLPISLSNAIAGINSAATPLYQASNNISVALQPLSITERQNLTQQINAAAYSGLNDIIQDLDLLQNGLNVTTEFDRASNALLSAVNAIFALI